MGDHPNSTPGKKPPAPSVSKRPAGSMTPLLRKTREHARMQGLDPSSWSDDDYVVVDDEIRVGRIYRELIHGQTKWRWLLQTVPAPPPNEGMADTLEEAKGGFKRRYEEVKGRK
jgi:hypothetical protein